MSEDAVSCCICGKADLSTVEGDGGSECELSNGEWVCSFECWDKAVSTPSKAQTHIKKEREDEDQG